MILPERNRKDLEEDIPAELRAGMTFLFAKNVTEVLNNALEPAPRAKRIKVTKGDTEKAAANQAQVAVDATLPIDIPQPSAPPAQA